MSCLARVRSLVLLGALATPLGAPAQDVKSGVDVWNVVPGRTPIVFIKAEGANVAKGETVCVLDTASRKESLANQTISVKAAEAAYENAKLTREVAEIGVKEYQEGTYLQNRETILGEIALAKSDLTRARDRVDWVDKMHKKGFVSERQLKSERLNLEKAAFVHETVCTKRVVLEKYTKDKTIKELTSEVEKSRADELAKLATWEHEQANERKLLLEIADCTILSPSDGHLRYLWPIEPGVRVREGDLLFRVVPTPESVDKD